VEPQAETTRPIPRGAREVLAYFLRHPRAADDLEGVARWRLQAERIERGLREVGEALGWLVREGYLRESRRSGARPIFALAPDRRCDAEIFLQDPAEVDEGGSF
jgi:hypothetical protein